MRYTVRPLSDRTWLRPAAQRTRSRFTTTWSDTLNLLGREINHLGGREVVLEIDVQERPQAQREGHRQPDRTATRRRHGRGVAPGRSGCPGPQVVERRGRGCVPDPLCAWVHRPADRAAVRTGCRALPEEGRVTTVSGWCSAPTGARPQHERCRMSPSCECSCHLESPVVERESWSQMVAWGQQSGPESARTDRGPRPLPAKDK